MAYRFPAVEATNVVVVDIYVGIELMAGYTISVCSLSNLSGVVLVYRKSHYRPVKVYCDYHILNSSDEVCSRSRLWSS